jgi:TPR repeat protein
MWTSIIASMREDKAGALNCYLIAADKGDAVAQTAAGVYYYAGYGTAVDYKKSLHWFAEAERQDNPDALAALSIYFQQGTGAPVFISGALLCGPR